MRPSARLSVRPETGSAADRPPRPRSARRHAVPVALVVVLAIVALPVLDVAIGRNFHVVVRGTCYRCAQPSVEQLRADVRYRGVRTVINLRGDCAPEAWYEDERRAARELGIEFVDVGLWASQPPPPEEIRRLVQALDHSPRPILLHCLRGSDRTGLASAVVLLLLTDADPAAARRQLGVCYGHLARGNWLAMDRFFDQYEAWLKDRSLYHTSDRFRRWACEEYAVPWRQTSGSAVPPGRPGGLPPRLVSGP